MIRIIMCITVLMFVSGCDLKKQSSLPKDVNSNKEQSSFPPFLTGTWKSDDPKISLWEFTIQPDGKISSMQNFLGIRVNVSEGQANKRIPEMNIEQACTLGPVDVNYEPKTRVLSVKVVTDYYMMYVVEQMIEGRSVDTFTGTISADNSIWNAEWKSYSGTINGTPVDFNNPAITKVTFEHEKSTN